MKEESKIAELIAELLKRADKQDEILEKHGEILEMQGKLLERHGLLLEKLVEGQYSPKLLYVK